MPQNVASDLSLHCLPFVQQFLNTSMDLYEIKDKYGKQLRFLTISGNYVNI